MDFLYESENLDMAASPSVLFGLPDSRPARRPFRRGASGNSTRLRCIDQATNSSEIIQTVLKGYGRPATQLIAPEIFGFDSSISLPRYDTDTGGKLPVKGPFSNIVVPIYELQGGSYRMENLLRKQWKKSE